MPLPALGADALFAEQVRRRPDAIALTHNGRDLRYRELDERVAAIAGVLAELGLPRETRVGIYLPRTLDLVAAMFAISRAGYCGVPMDPAYPKRRLEDMAAASIM